MSKAVVFTAYGGPDVLHVIDVNPPEPGPGQVRVRVKAAGIQPFDGLLRSGTAHQWLPARFPQQLGNEFSGIVDALGQGVTAFSIGDQVLGWAVLASYAEHVVAGVEDIVPKPAGMPWAEAGALPASGQTASTALQELGVGPGDTVLIHGAAGGVGTFAVQLAVAMGATVIGTANARNHDYLRSLGAIPVAYDDDLSGRVRAVAPDGVDVALDAAGTVEALRVSLEMVADQHRIGTISFQPAAAELGIRRLSTNRSAARLRALTDLYTAGKLRVVIRRIYPLAEAREAHRQLETGHGHGKIVLNVMPFTDGEIAYMALPQRLGRLATVQPDGTLQNSPVGVHYNDRLDTIDIGGQNMQASRKFRNVRTNGRVALVIDDIASVQPWRVRCLEIRGHAEALSDPPDAATGFPGAIVRVHPERIISWGIDPEHLSLGKRTVSAIPPGH